MIKRNIISLIILILILLGIGVFWYFNLAPKVNVPKVSENATGSSSTESTSSASSSEETYSLSLATTTNQKILSLVNWKTFDGEKATLKRGIIFIYPETWQTNFTSCGDISCDSPFFLPDESTKLHKTRVALFAIHPMNSPVLNKTIKVLDRFETNIDGYDAEVTHQIISLNFGRINYGTHTEWTLIIKNVEGSNGTLNRYEFHMQDIYENSKDVFMKIVNSIQIEPYSSFKLKN